MKKFGKNIAVALGLVASVFCIGAGLVGCGGSTNLATIRFNLILDELEMLVMGNDAYGWNVLCVDPEGSFGYVRDTDPEWYSYSGISRSDISEVSEAFKAVYDEFKGIDVKKLRGTDVAKYYSTDYFLQTYVRYYGSPYAWEFTLFGGDYISSEGGYVADFAACFENYMFRNENDVKDLLAITRSTKDAFATYTNFAAARVSADYPLYDYTINGMQDYLDAIIEKGDDYYLYEFAEHKIDQVTFLSDAKKSQYKQSYADALKNSFMKGVSKLSANLEVYKGNVQTIDKSCLAEYGRAGKAYYEWLLYSKTGMEDTSVGTVYTQTYNAYLEYDAQFRYINNEIAELESARPELYAEVMQYIDGEKAVLGLSEPDEMMEYLKVAAKAIVPDLDTMPEIDFKIMDDTVAEISNTDAYYLQSPVDEVNSVEHVTINPRLIDSDPGDLLFTLAHEGYPGHLYASVNAKEDGFRIMGRVSSCIAFSEGWANYAAVTIFRNLAESTDDEALAMYCEYKYLQKIRGYLNTQLLEFQVNYYGVSVDEFMDPRDEYESDEQYEQEKAEITDMVGTLMGMPAVYIPYSYGMYVMIELHETARRNMGSDYDEVKLNGMLLSEGMAPTLDRAKEITYEYI